MPVQIAFALFSGAPSWEAEVVTTQYRNRWPSEPALVLESQEGSSLCFSCGTTTVLAALMPAPYPSTDLEGALRRDRLWPHAGEAMASNTHHAVVSILTSPTPGSGEMLVLSRTLEAIMISFPSAMGSYWPGSDQLVRKDVLIDLMSTGPDGSAQVMWIDLRIGSRNPGESFGFTVGLEPLGHRELEVTSAPETPDRLWNRLYGLAAYLIKAGPVLQDGHTVGGSGDERISVNVGPSEFGLPGEVTRLVFPPSRPT